MTCELMNECLHTDTGCRLGVDGCTYVMLLEEKEYHRCFAEAMQHYVYTATLAAVLIPSFLCLTCCFVAFNMWISGGCPSWVWYPTRTSTSWRSSDNSLSKKKLTHTRELVKLRTLRRTTRTWLSPWLFQSKMLRHHRQNRIPQSLSDQFISGLKDLRGRV